MPSRSPCSALLFAVIVLMANALTGVQAQAEDKKLLTTVLLIRHAEEPPEKDDSSHLSSQGHQRAAALPDLFQATTRRPDPLPVPDFLIAAKSSKRSRRPLETVEPLAGVLGQKIDTDYDDDDDVARLAEDLLNDAKFAGKTILICWRQESLPELAHQLGAKDAPKNWKGEVYDRVWQLSLGEAGRVKFADRPQSLLPGDSQ